MIRIVLTAGLLSLAALAAQPASAAASHSDRTPAQTTVALKGADLGNGDSAKFAYARLEAAAKRVCDSDGASDPLTANDDRACEQDAMRDALATVNAPQLSMLAQPDEAQSEDADRYAVNASATADGTR